MALEQEYKFYRLTFSFQASIYDGYFKKRESYPKIVSGVVNFLNEYSGTFVPKSLLALAFERKVNLFCGAFACRKHIPLEDK